MKLRNSQQEGALKNFKTSMISPDGANSQNDLDSPMQEIFNDNKPKTMQKNSGHAGTQATVEAQNQGTLDAISSKN